MFVRKVPGYLLIVDDETAFTERIVRSKLRFKGGAEIVGTMEDLQQLSYDFVLSVTVAVVDLRIRWSASSSTQKLTVQFITALQKVNPSATVILLHAPEFLAEAQQAVLQLANVVKVIPKTRELSTFGLIAQCIREQCEGILESDDDTTTFLIP